MLAACPVLDALITRTPADEEPLCGNAAVCIIIIIIIIIRIWQDKLLRETYLKLSDSKVFLLELLISLVLSRS